MRTGTKECDIYTIIVEKHEAKEFHNAVNDSGLQITVYRDYFHRHILCHKGLDISSFELSAHIVSMLIRKKLTRKCTKDSMMICRVPNSGITHLATA